MKKLLILISILIVILIFTTWPRRTDLDVLTLEHIRYIPSKSESSFLNWSDFTNGEHVYQYMRRISQMQLRNIEYLEGK